MPASASTTDNSGRLLDLLNSPYDIGPTGNIRQALNPSSPCRTNLSWLGATLVDGALNGTEVGTVVAVPVSPGDVLQTVKLAVGKTKGKKVEAGFAAVYVGVKGGALVAQSKSALLKETVLAEEPLSFTLESTVAVTAATAPHGYVYVVLALEAETMPTCIGVSASKEAQACVAKLSVGAPECMAGSVGTALKTKAAATLGTVTVVAQVPLVILH